MSKHNFIIEEEDLNMTFSEKKKSIKQSIPKLYKEYQFNRINSIRYLLQIQSKMTIAGISSENTVHLRWILNLKEINPSGYLFELLLLDNTMIKTNNDGFAEVHKLVAQMQKALNEVIFYTNRKCTVTKVVNINTIKKKWIAVKNEMVEYNRQMKTLNDLFSIQEKNFEEKGGVEKMVSSIEFFDLYFNNIYGRKFPFIVSKILPNFFRTADFYFDLEFKNEPSIESNNIIRFKGRPSISKKEMKKAYESFSFIDLDYSNPEFSYDGAYLINTDDGFIEKGKISYKEIISSMLSAEITYKIERYE